MAEPLKAAQVAWYRWPTVRWGLAAVAVALGAGVAIWQWPLNIDIWQWWPPNIDSTSKRWANLLKENKSDCFEKLTKDSKEPIPTCLRYDEPKQPDPARPVWYYPHVAVYSTSAPPHQTPTLRDLGDHGQAQAISFLEKGSGLKGRAWADLREALDQATPGAGERDPFRFDRILIANVAKGIDWKPGDRMVWIRIIVQPINFSFAGYSVAATEHETLNVTSVERTDSRKVSADLGATMPGMEGPKAGLGLSSEHTVKTDSDIKAQYEKLGIDILPNFLRIMRESENGGDAVGNTKVSVTVVTDPEMIRRQEPEEQIQQPSGDDPINLLVTGTHFEADEQSAGNKPAIDVRPQLAVPHCALRARVWMLYEERKVEGDGHKYYEEGKQSVTLVRDAENKQPVDIMSADEVSPAVWSLRLCEDNHCAKGDELRAKVQPGRPGSEGRKVVFTDYGVAWRLAYWLRTGKTNTPPHTSYEFIYPRDAYGKPVALLPLLPVKADKEDDCNKKPKEERPVAESSIKAYSKRVAGRRFADVKRQGISGQ
jgi:hypothetical protein